MVAADLVVAAGAVVAAVGAFTALAFCALLVAVVFVGGTVRGDAKSAGASA